LVQQIFIGVEQALDCYGLKNSMTAVESAFSSIGIMVIAVLGGRTPSIIRWQAAVAVAATLAHGIGARYLLRKLAPSFSWSSASLREFSSRSAWTCLTTLGAAIFSQADRIVVGGVLGVSMAGTYDAITKVTSQINTFSGLAVQPVLPYLSGRS